MACVLVLLQSQGSVGGKSKAKRTGGGRTKKGSTAQDDGNGVDEGGEGEIDAGEEFVKEIGEVVDWCTRVVVPALNENFMKG